MPLRRRVALVAHPRPTPRCQQCGKPVPAGERRLVPRFDQVGRRAVLRVLGPCCAPLEART